MRQTLCELPGINAPGERDHLDGTGNLETWLRGAIEPSAGSSMCSGSSKNDSARSHQTGEHDRRQSHGLLSLMRAKRAMTTVQQINR